MNCKEEKLVCEKQKKEYKVTINSFTFGRPSSIGCGQGTCNGKSN